MILPVSSSSVLRLESLLGRLESADLSHPETEVLAREAKELAETLGDEASLVKSQYWLLAYHIKTNDFDTAWQLYQELEPKALLLDETWHTRITNQGAKAYFGIGGYEQSLRLSKQALGQSRNLGNTPLETDALKTVAFSYHRMGLYQEALEHHTERLELANKLGEKNTTNILSGIAMVYSALGSDTQAISYYEQALTLCQDFKDPGQEAMVLSNLANCYDYEIESEKVLDLTWQAFHNYEKHGFKRQASISLCNIAICYEGIGRLSEALECYDTCVDRLREAPDLFFEAMLRRSRGDFFLEQHHDVTKAKAELLEGLRAAQEGNISEEEFKILELLSRVAEAEADFKTALEYHKRFHNLKEKVEGEAVMKNMQTLMTRFDVERIKQEQEIYQLKNIELARAVEKLEELSQRDGLTGIFNRRYLDTCLSRLFQEARLLDKPLSVLMADIDNFKKINDRFSHAVGDEVLKIVAQLFKDNIWGADVVARYGGEEFVVIFSNTGLEQAHHVAEKIRQKIETYPWHELRPELRVTASMGLCADTSLASYEKLLAKADDNLYVAKHTGKNKIIF